MSILSKYCSHSHTVPGQCSAPSSSLTDGFLTRSTLAVPSRSLFFFSFVILPVFWFGKAKLKIISKPNYSANVTEQSSFSELNIRSADKEFSTLCERQVSFTVS